MKRENMDYKTKNKNSLEDNGGDSNLNPELLKVEISPLDSTNKQKRLIKLNTHSDNSKIDSNPKIISHEIGMDAKIKHRKKRDGD